MSEEREEINLGSEMVEINIGPGGTRVVGQSDIDAKVDTIEHLLAAAPEGLDEFTLLRLGQSFNLAVLRAKNCELKEMVGNIMLFSQNVDELIDEMAWGFRHETLKSEDYDEYVRALGLFQRRTIPDTISKILTDTCKCGAGK